jgi:hypothetical protein
MSVPDNQNFVGVRINPRLFQADVGSVSSVSRVRSIVSQLDTGRLKRKNPAPGAGFKNC